MQRCTCVHFFLILNDRKYFVVCILFTYKKGRVRYDITLINPSY